MHMLSIYVVEKQKLVTCKHETSLTNLTSFTLVDETNVYSSCELVKFTPMKRYETMLFEHCSIFLLFRFQEEISRIEKEGIMIKVTEPTELCAPTVPVVK